MKADAAGNVHRQSADGNWQSRQDGKWQGGQPAVAEGRWLRRDSDRGCAAELFALLGVGCENLFGLPMKNKSILVLLAVLLGAPSASRADVVYLKSGGKMEGRIVERTDSSVEIDIGAGSLTLPMSNVDRIEEGRSPLDDYDERAAKLSADDRDGWLELARWASRKGLGTQSSRAYEQVLTIDPNDSEANRALGRVEVDGRWMTEEEAYRAQGYVMFEGHWTTPAEQESILRAREADRDAAQAQAQTAEARAREADARAREAEAQAQQSTYQTPLYWNSWGPGPRTWPRNPLDRPQQPITRR